MKLDYIHCRQFCMSLSSIMLIVFYMLLYYLPQMCVFAVTCFNCMHTCTWFSKCVSQHVSCIVMYCAYIYVCVCLWFGVRIVTYSYRSLWYSQTIIS